MCFLLKEIVQANAKINIGLNVIGQLDNGYHILDMIMAPINLCDRLEISISDKSGTLKINTNIHDIPTDHRNILYKIYEAFYRKSALEPRDITVFLEKKIPHEAGLGGGSSDGAAFLKTLNKYHQDFFPKETLSEIGLKIGADIPFFIENTCARAGGIGEVLTPVENNLSCKIIIVKPDFGVSTKTAYKNLTALAFRRDADIASVIEGLRENSAEKVIHSVENHLEQALLITDSKIATLKKTLEEWKDYRFFMSGSGSAYFALVSENTTEEQLQRLRNMLMNCEVFLCSFL